MNLVDDFIRCQEELGRSRRECDALNRLVSAQRMLLIAYKKRLHKSTRESAARDVEIAEQSLAELREAN